MSAQNLPSRQLTTDLFFFFTFASIARYATLTWDDAPTHSVCLGGLMYMCFGVSYTAE